MIETLQQIASNPFLWITVTLIVLAVGMQTHASGKSTFLAPRWLSTLREQLGLSVLPNAIVLLLVILWMVFFLALTTSALFILWGVLERVSPNNQAEATDLRWSMLALAGIVAASGGVIAIPFSFLRIKNDADQTEIEFQGQITDRITRAVEGLGAIKYTKEVQSTQKYLLDGNGKFLLDDNGNGIRATQPDGTLDVSHQVLEQSEPNLEVRIGAIYALERIAQDSLRDHVQIMEILCAYVRENANQPRIDHAATDAAVEKDSHGFSSLSAFGDSQAPQVPIYSQPREDIQTALTVICRRRENQLEVERTTEQNGHSYRLDLRGCFLVKANLNGANLQSAQFDDSNLSEALLYGANLKHARLNKTNLSKARLASASLEYASLNGADLTRAQVANTNFHLSAVKGCKLCHLKSLTYEQVSSMFGDSSTRLDFNIAPPEHWPERNLSWTDFLEMWRQAKRESSLAPPR